MLRLYYLNTIRSYEQVKVSRDALKSLSWQTFGLAPFDSVDWQIDSAAAILKGQDILLDVGRWIEDTVAFSLRLVLDKKAIANTA